MVKVLDDTEQSKAFPVTNTVKKGCILDRTFSMVFSAMQTDAFHDCKKGIFIKYNRTDGGLYEAKRLQAVTKVKEIVIRDFLFPDDCALNANTEQMMQNGMDHLSKACN